MKCSFLPNDLTPEEHATNREQTVAPATTWTNTRTRTIAEVSCGMITVRRRSEMRDGFAADSRIVADVYNVGRVVAMDEEVACDAAVVIDGVDSATQ